MIDVAKDRRPFSVPARNSTRTITPRLSRTHVTMSCSGPIVEDLRKPKCKKRYHADSGPQPQKRRDNIGLCKPRPLRRPRCQRQHFDSTGQFTILAQFDAAQSQQN
jgi:hypothetical protein